VSLGFVTAGNHSVTVSEAGGRQANTTASPSLPPPLTQVALLGAALRSVGRHAGDRDVTVRDRLERGDWLQGTLHSC